MDSTCVIAGFSRDLLTDHATRAEFDGMVGGVDWDGSVVVMAFKVAESRPDRQAHVMDQSGRRNLLD